MNKRQWKFLIWQKVQKKSLTIQLNTWQNVCHIETKNKSGRKETWQSFWKLPKKKLVEMLLPATRVLMTSSWMLAEQNIKPSICQNERLTDSQSDKQGQTDKQSNRKTVSLLVIVVIWRH